MRSGWQVPPLLIAFALLLPLTSRAATVHVPADYPTIQAGVNAAAAGDTIEIACGFYAEAQIVIMKSIHLTSATGQADCVVIDPLGGGFVCWNGAVVTFTGLTIRNAGGYDGPALLIQIDGHCVVERCRFENNIGGEFAGAVKVDDGVGGPPASLTLRDCAFSSNVSSYSGGAVLIKLSAPTSAAEIERCTFEDNQKGAVRAILDNPALHLAVRNSVFAHNLGLGGVVCSGTGSLTLESCTFTDNQSSGTAGSVFFGGGRVLRLDSCTFSGNSAQGSGGAVECVGDSLWAALCVFTQNESVGGNGGALSVGSPRFAITGCRFAGNHSGGEGGALYADAPVVIPVPSINASTFTGNSCVTYGGAVSVGAGGVSPHIVNCTVAGNRSFVAGGMHFLTHTFAQVERCVVWGNCATFAPQLYGPDMVVSCSDIEGGWSGNGNLAIDPQFCDPTLCTVAPTDGGTWRLVETSPCLPAGNSCGALIGALGQGCGGPTGVDAGLDQVSWARLKVRYH